MRGSTCEPGRKQAGKGGRAARERGTDKRTAGQREGGKEGGREGGREGAKIEQDMSQLVSGVGGKQR